MRQDCWLARQATLPLSLSLSCTESSSTQKFVFVVDAAVDLEQSSPFTLFMFTFTLTVPLSLLETETVLTDSVEGISKFSTVVWPIGRKFWYAFTRRKKYEELKRLRVWPPLRAFTVIFLYQQNDLSGISIMYRVLKAHTKLMETSSQGRNENEI